MENMNLIPYYSHLIFDKDAKNTECGGKASSRNDAEKNVCAREGN